LLAFTEDADYVGKFETTCYVAKLIHFSVVPL
jgi:hypothetical protein